MNALEVAKKYVTAARALRSNTHAVMELIHEEKVDSPAFQQIWKQREEAFLNWNNAAVLVRQLPIDDMAAVVRVIEQMQAS